MRRTRVIGGRSATEQQGGEGTTGRCDHSGTIQLQHPILRQSGSRRRARPATEREWIVPSRNCIAAAARMLRGSLVHIMHAAFLPAPLHLRSRYGAAASLRRRPDSSQQQMRPRCPRCAVVHGIIVRRQRVSWDPDVPAIQCGILLPSSHRTMIRRQLYAHEKRVTIF